MMINPVFEDRRHAAFLLAGKLSEHRGTNAILVAIPKGGLEIAYELSHLLNLEVIAIPCKKLSDPTDPFRTIASVTSQNVIMHAVGYDIPQNYVDRRVKRLRAQLLEEETLYDTQKERHRIKGRTVIVVDDFVRTGDSMRAILVDIANENPVRIVVASPLVSWRASMELANLADEVVYCQLMRREDPVEAYYRHFDKLTAIEARKFLEELQAGCS